jgi:uncharacterized membrane protein YccC
MRISTRRWRTRIPAACVLSALLLVAAVPMGTALAEPEQRPGNPVEFTLERFADVLARLEAELAALEAPATKRLEEGLEQIIELIGNLLDEFDRPREEDEDGTAIGARIVELDLKLHRLLYVLDEIVESAADTPARPRAKGALDGLREWIDGYIDGATAGMNLREAARFERTAHEMIRSLAQRLADMAHNAQKPDRGRPILGRLVERLEELLFRLDGFILHHFDQPPPRE